uniref:Uncharacterized protein n=1 Tax=Rhizophora mucronata TaxID=61149 RepID=A0A2P2QUZ4_RHIMU
MSKLLACTQNNLNKNVQSTQLPISNALFSYFNNQTHSFLNSQSLAVRVESWKESTVREETGFHEFLKNAIQQS